MASSLSLERERERGTVHLLSPKNHIIIDLLEKGEKEKNTS